MCRIILKRPTATRLNALAQWKRSLRVLPPLHPGSMRETTATAHLQSPIRCSCPRHRRLHSFLILSSAEEFSELLLITEHQHADVRTKCTLIKKSCKKDFLQRQVKTAIRKSSSWGDFLGRLEQMYPV